MCERCEDLEWENKRLRALLKSEIPVPLEYNLRPTGRALYRAMIGKGLVPVERLIAALGRDGLADVTLRNHIRDMRKRLSKHGVYIRTVWGEGYEIIGGGTP